MFYRGPGLLAVVWFGLAPSTPPSPPPLSKLSLSQSSCVSPVELTYGRGRGWERSQIRQRRESLVLYKSFNALWSNPSFRATWEVGTSMGSYIFMKISMIYHEYMYICSCHWSFITLQRRYVQCVHSRYSQFLMFGPIRWKVSKTLVTVQVDKRSTFRGIIVVPRLALEPSRHNSSKSAGFPVNKWRMMTM